MLNGHILTYQSEIDYSAFEPVNDLLSKVKIRILYAGLNRNNSYLSKEVIEDAIKSLPYIPIVGEYDKSIKNFRGHGGRIIIDDRGGIEFEDTVKAYGVVPFFNDSKPRWEVYEDSETGKPTEYLVADAYLWTGRYGELEVVTSGGSYQSMEILIKDADWVKSKNISSGQYDYYNINEFTFTAFCILGKDEINEENSTIPCFEDAAIEAYNYNATKLSNDLSQMVAELQSFNLERSEEILDNDSKQSEKIIVENEVKTEDFEANLEVEQPIDNLVVNELEKEPTINEEVFELSHEEIRSNLYELLVSNNMENTNNVWVVSVYSDHFIYEVYPNEFYKQAYSINDNNISLVDIPTKVYSQFLTEQEKVELDILKGQADNLLLENESLKQYKEKRENEDKLKAIEELFAKYNMLDDDEVAQLKINAHSLDLADLEKEIAYHIVNKGIFSFDNKKEKPKTLVMKVNENKQDDLTLRYGDVARFF